MAEPAFRVVVYSPDGFVIFDGQTSGANDFVMVHHPARESTWVELRATAALSLSKGGGSDG